MNSPFSISHYYRNSGHSKFLHVNKDKSPGLLIFGASRFLKELVMVLISNNARVLLADNNGDNIRLATMKNIPVYYGNTTSAHALDFLDLTGIGRLLVLSSYNQLNPLVTCYYQYLLGEEKVYRLDCGDEKTVDTNCQIHIGNGYVCLAKQFPTLN
ncbi:MAG: hypothetical protein ACI9IJ_002316 [Psychromonas sp.]|jgi:hypothetical protein